MLKYEMVPVINLCKLDDELRKLFPTKEFNLLVDLFDCPANDSCVWFSMEEYPLADDGWHSEGYAEIYNLVCDYLSELNLPSKDILVDVTW